jgi:hypothetical protein
MRVTDRTILTTVSSGNSTLKLFLFQTPSRTLANDMKVLSAILNSKCL